MGVRVRGSGLELGFQALNAGSGSGEVGGRSEIPIDGEDIDTVVSLNH